MIRNPVLLLTFTNCPPPTYTEKKQEYELMFRDKFTLLTTRPDPLYKCLGGRALVAKDVLVILQVGIPLVP